MNHLQSFQDDGGRAASTRPTPALTSVAGALLPLVLLLAVGACSAGNGTGTANAAAFRFQQSNSDATMQIARLIPLGTPLGEASTTLSAQGFICNPTNPPSDTIHASTLCVHTPPADPPPGQRLATPPTPVTWLVTLDAQDGSHVSAIRVTRTPKDIH